jgi:hypothetical protein
MRSAYTRTNTALPAALASTLYRLRSWLTRQVVVARIGFSTKPAKLPTNGVRLGCSASNTSQTVLSLTSGWRVRLA